MKAVIYLLQVSACSAIFYLFYFLLLRKLTFFTLNRWFLLIAVLLSFLIPTISLPVDRGQPHIVIVQQAVNINSLQFSSAEQTIVRVKTAPKIVDYLLFLRAIYWIVVIGLSVQLIVTLIRFFRKLKGKQTVKSGRVNIIQSQNAFPNGSFFNYIFLNDQELSADEMQQIIAHEMLHVRLAHSVDRILIKIAQILLWFNPFIYFYAKSAEENHEFEVDRALTNATDKRSYANLLLHLSVAGGGTLYHSFSKVPLKKRIAMLFNQPSAKMKKVIYVLIVPVVLISCLAFAKLKSNKADNKYFKKVEKADKSPLILKDQFYTRSRLKDKKGRDYDKVIVQTKENNGRSTYSNLKVNGKAVFLIDKKPYTEAQIKNMPSSFIATLYLKGSFFGKKQAAFPADIAKYDAIFILHTKKDTDTTKYQQKLKRSPEEIKEEMERKAYQQTGDFKQKEKLANEINGKTITVKVMDIIDKSSGKVPPVVGNALCYLVDYNSYEYLIQTNSLLNKIGDEITVKVFMVGIFKNSPDLIIPPIDIIPHPFLYEANKVRYADGQITNIQKYPNGKWKSAVLEIVNGYKLNLGFKPTAPDFSNIEEGDHLRFRFVHEVKTGAKTYQINDWVSISTNVKDYGIKNPDFFYKFYEPTTAQNQDPEHNFKVTSLTYQASEKVVTALKKDQPNSFVSAGKIINVNILLKEQGRVYKFLAAMFPHVEKKNIVFNVDTTQQKGFCTIKTVVKPSV